MEIILRSFIVVSALLTLCLMGCGSNDTQPETAGSQSPGQPGGTAGAASPAQPTTSDASATEDDDWQLYRNRQYSLTLRYPLIYTLRVSEDTSDPDCLLRIGLLSPDAVGSPLEDRIPPAFAAAVHDNSVRRSIEEWIEEKLTPAKSRYGISVVTIGGIPGLRVTYQTQLAPNIFYYVAREGYVYRFTPLGQYSEQILESVQFGL